MFIIFVSCVTLIILSNSLSSWLVRLFKKRSHMLSQWTLGDILSFFISWQLKTRALVSCFRVPLWVMNHTGSKLENMEANEGRCLLDLPELPLHCILDRLPPDGLCTMAAVCTSLRDQCRSDYYWEKHLSEKWGRILGEAAYKEWQCYIAARARSISLSRQVKQRYWLSYFLSVLPGYSRKPDLKKSGETCQESQPQKESTMALYLALDSGKFWFPAQVYNRENGHAGFMLSCYDAKVRYESTTDTFHARYSPHGRQTLEENIEWGRLRAPVVDTPAKALHISDCLADLQPGDDIEIQWRRNKEFPYGWWYGVVGHLETCEGGEYHCRCHQSDTVVLEFKQYAQGSRWRKTLVKRDTHREEGNTVDGFYGGIRKLSDNEEISIWKRLWPPKILE
uniref:F-box domain-containing protein n=1 Tax=Kalanchoe fedtschenkoi TaxID=63787 RepID=A0A7N0VKF7_KALFE